MMDEFCSLPGQIGEDRLCHVLRQMRVICSTCRKAAE